MPRPKKKIQHYITASRGPPAWNQVILGQLMMFYGCRSSMAPSSSNHQRIQFEARLKGRNTTTKTLDITKPNNNEQISKINPNISDPLHNDYASSRSTPSFHPPGHPSFAQAAAKLQATWSNKVMFITHFRRTYQIIIWLVVGPPLWKIWQSIGMIIPNIWENKKWQPNNQPEIIMDYNLYSEDYSG